MARNICGGISGWGVDDAGDSECRDNSDVSQEYSNDVRITIVYTRVLNRGGQVGHGVRSPVEGL